MTSQPIAVITNNPAEAFQSLAIRGAVQTFQHQKVEHQVIQFDKHRQTLKAVFDPTKVDGLLVIADSLWDDDLRTLHASDLPVTLVSHRVPDLPLPTLLSNNLQGINLLMAHLVEECGCRRLVFIEGLAHQEDARERRLYFERAALRYRLPPDQTIYLKGDFSPHTAAQAVEGLLAQGIPFDGILAADYLMGVAALECLEAHRIPVPEQVCVSGYGDANAAELAGLTTVNADIQELGMRAAQQLLSQLNGLKISGVTTISVSLKVRRTTCFLG